MPIQISIVTPSYNQPQWLRLAVASVADQTGLQVEQIIQDAGTPGLRAALQPHFAPHFSTNRLRLYIEKDEGMYDAINRGLRRCGGEVCAYLNCDEQYLPGALARVAETFRKDPKLDLLLAGTVVVDGEGTYLCSRLPLLPSLHELRSGRMYNLTSSIFFRARIFRERNIWFDPQLKIVGDREWLRQVLEAGARVATLDLMTSTFADLGSNLALQGNGPAEGRSGAGWGRRLSDLAATGSHRLRRLWTGQYHLQPFSYSLYTLSHPDERQTFEVKKPTGIWRNRLRSS